jgi:hypothetical protein
MQPNASLEKRLLANPTATEFAAMLSEHNAALSNFLDGTQDTPEAEERCSKAYDALWAARPNDPAVMAMQLRWLLREMDVGDYPDDRRVLEHVAEQLDAIAGGLFVVGRRRAAGAKSAAPRTGRTRRDRAATAQAT